MILHSDKKGREYAYVEIKNKRIIAVGEESLGGGGWTWCKDWLRQPNHSTLQDAMSSIGVEFPAFYEKVRNKVDNNLLPIEVVKHEHIMKEIRHADLHVRAKQTELVQAKDRKKALKKELSLIKAKLNRNKKGWRK